MAEYYLLVSMTLLFCIFDFVQSQAIRLPVYVSYCLFLVLFVGLRSIGVDNDSANYEEAFKIAGKTPWIDLITGNYDETMERAYLLLNKLIYSLNGSVHGVFLIMATLTGLVNFTLIYQRSPFPFMSLLMYVCLFYFYRDFTQIRYALSAGLGLWAIFMFIDAKYVKCLLLVFAAAFLHSSVIVVLFFIPAYLLVPNKQVLFCLPLVGLILGFFNPTMRLFEMGGLPPTLANYVLQDEFGRGGYMVSILAQLVMAGILIFRERLIAFYYGRTMDVLFASLAWASFINLMFISFSIMQRLSSLLFGAILFAVPYLCEVLEQEDVAQRKNDRFIALALRFFFILFVLYYGMNMIDINLMRPYSMF